MEQVVNTSLSELYRIFNHFNSCLFSDRLEQVFIFIESAKRKAGSVLGWCSNNRPISSDNGEYIEISIASETLNSSYEEIAHIVLHEMVHAWNVQSGVNDGTGSYHNKKFKLAAESHGLNCEKTNKGFNVTSFDGNGRIALNSLTPNLEAFTFFRKLPDPKPSVKTSWKFKCPNCGIVIHSSRSSRRFKCLNCISEAEMVLED